MEDTATMDVMRAPREALDRIGGVLARAFFDDPGYRHVVPEDPHHGRAVEWIMRLATRYGDRYGEVHAPPDGSCGGGAVWLPPGDTSPGPLRLLRVGFAAAPLVLGLGGVGRMIRLIEVMDTLHRKHMPGAHYYLAFLGVDPALQGRGIGGRLLEPALRRARAEGLPCYLETFKERNLPFYRRFGFEVAAQASAPGGGPPFWTMARPGRERGA